MSHEPTATQLLPDTVAAVKAGHSNFTAIFAAVEKSTQHNDLWVRKVDAALQLARRRGLIHYTGQKTGWKEGPKP